MGKDYLLCDLSHALAVRRRDLIYRVFVIARPDVELTERGSIRSSWSGAAPEVSIVFTGQGTQWSGMGKRLLDTDAGFAADLQKMVQILQSPDTPPSWNLQGILRGTTYVSISSIDS